MMYYILLLVYFVHIVTGDDSSEAKYIDLLPEKEKEEFLETVARRIFDNFKHKNAVPERDEHTKLIKKVLKEESLNLKKISQNTSDDSDGKSNVASENEDALDLMREGKRNKRNSLKENNNSDTVSIQKASKETYKVNYNELSKELGLSDTEDIEVKHSSNKQTEGSYEENTTKSYVEGIETEIIVKDLSLLSSKENGSVQNGENNHEQEGKTTKPTPLVSKPEETRDTNIEGQPRSEIIETTKTPELSYSLTDKINITSRKNGNSEPTNNSTEKYTKQESVAITEKTILSTSHDVLAELASKEAIGENLTNVYIKSTKSEENKVGFANKIKKIVIISPKIEATEITTEFIKINETRKAYDKLVSNFDTDKIKLDNIRDERDNQDTKAVVDDKTLTKKTNVPAINVELDDNYFDDENTAAAVNKNQDHTSLNDLVSSTKEHYERVKEKIKRTNSVTETENNDTKISEAVVNGTENSNETIIKVMKNSKDYIKKKHSIEGSVVNDFNGTTLGSNINSIVQNSNISKGNLDMVTTTTIYTTSKINNNKEINIEESTEKTINKSNGVTDDKNSETTMQNTLLRKGPEIVKTTSEKIFIEEYIGIEIKNYTKMVPENDYNKTEVNNEKVSTESINITFIHDNSAEKNKSNSAKISPNRTIYENNTIEYKQGTPAKTNNETTTVKIEKLSVATDLYKSETNGKDFRIKEDANPKEMVSENDYNKTEVNNEKVSTESINITFIHDNSAEKTKSNSVKISPNRTIYENNTFEYKQGTTSKTNKETTTVKIETLTVATDLYKSETNGKDFRIKEDANPYINQDKIFKTPIPKINQASVIVGNEENKMGKKIEKIEKNSVNFVNDMIKVIRASISEKPNEKLKPLSLLEDNPKPKEYTVYKSPKRPLDQNNEPKDDKFIEENPYYVPVYNYGAEHAYYNPKNRLGPNADDDDITIIKNDGLNVESVAHDYDSIVKDNVYNDNDYTKNYYQNHLDSNDNNARNDVDYDEAYNKEKELIDRMGDTNGNYIFTAKENLRGRDTENAQKLKKVEYMKHLVKIYKNRNSKNGNRKRSFSKYKLNLPIVVNYPKYSDIIMNSHDYLDVDYRYPTWNKPKNARSRKHRILRGNENNFPRGIIITGYADDPDSDEDDTIGFQNQQIKNDIYNDEKTKHQKSEKPYEVRFDDDYENYIKKQDQYGKINLFESREYVLNKQDIKEKRNKKEMKDEKSHGAKNQIRKIREMMYSTGEFGFLKPKKVVEKNHSVLKEFINIAPKMCDVGDESCVEPIILINDNHLYSKKQTDSARRAMNTNIASDYFITRTNDAVVDYVPKLPAKSRITEHPQNPYNNNDDDMTFEGPDQDHPNIFMHWETVKNISVILSHLDPILNSDDTRSHNVYKENYKKPPKQKILRFRSKYKKLPSKTIRDDDKSRDGNQTDSHVPKPNIIKFDGPAYPHQREEYKPSDTKSDEKTDITSQTNTKQKNKYNKVKTLKSIMKIVPDDVEIMLKVSDMLDNYNSDENEGKIKKKEDVKEEKEGNKEEKEDGVDEKGGGVEEKEGGVEEKEGDVEDWNSQCLRSIESIDVESYVSVLQDMVRNEAKGLVQYNWMGTSIDIQAGIFKLKEMTESVKNNEVLDQLDFKLLKYFTFLHKFATKRQKDLRMVLPKPKYKYNRTRSEKGLYSRMWLKRRLKKFAFEVSGTDLQYFVEFLEELQFYLYDLHTALTQIAMVTSYKNQNWFKNLNELYLNDSRKNILELLLHVTTARLLDLVENSLQTGLQDGFLKYVMMNEKEIEKSKDELLLILRIIEELKKTE